MSEKMRIYIGGLGSTVQEDDLKKTFSSPQLGDVESVEIIRSKGRSFGYLEFVPASEKGLVKLFSTYNGCLWKGGRLKLEKAKEDYLSRLQHEWQEEAELKIKLSSQDAEENESVNTLEKLKKHQDIEKMQLKIFFPKLRKIKAVPFKGTGKHKYSFQRVQIPPLPIHFCDCEEHSGPPLAKGNQTIQHETKLTNKCETDDQETGIYEVNENELNMMRTILDKLLEKENPSENAPNEPEETNSDVIGAVDCQVDENEDEASDEDDLLINVTSQSSKRVAVFEDWGQITTAVKNQNFQDSLLREAKSSNEPVCERHENKKGKRLADKKRKLSDQNHADNIMPSERKARTGVRYDSGDDPAATNLQPTDAEPGSVKSSLDVVSSHKSAWRNLVREKESSAFHISDILTVHNPKAETEARSDVPADAPSANEKVEHDDQSCEGEESEIVPDYQSTKPSTSSKDKTGRGAAWLQKLSWLQLVGDATTSAFNIGQILPGVTLEKQTSQQYENECSDSESGEQHKVVNIDQKSPVGDIGEPLGRVDKDVLGAQTNPDVNDLTKELNYINREEEKSNFDSQEKVEKEDRTNSAPNYQADGDVVISETCPFMRSAASLKEWTKAKAALSGAHKKKGKGKGKALVED